MSLWVSVLTLTLLCDTQANEKNATKSSRRRSRTKTERPNKRRLSEWRAMEINSFTRSRFIRAQTRRAKNSVRASMAYRGEPNHNHNVRFMRFERRHDIIRILQFSVAFVAILVCQWIRYESCWQLDVLACVLLAFFGAHLPSAVLPLVELCNSSHFASCFVFRPLQKICSHRINPLNVEVKNGKCDSNSVRRNQYAPNAEWMGFILLCSQCTNTCWKVNNVINANKICNGHRRTTVNSTTYSNGCWMLNTLSQQHTEIARLGFFFATNTPWPLALCVAVLLRQTDLRFAATINFRFHNWFVFSSLTIRRRGSHTVGSWQFRLPSSHCFHQRVINCACKSMPRLHLQIHSNCPNSIFISSMYDSGRGAQSVI